MKSKDKPQRVKAEEMSHELLRRLVTLQEDERSHISREIHDHFGQSISVLLLGLKSLETQVPVELAPLVQQLQQTADRLGQELHDLSIALRPTSLDDLGLATALANASEQWSRQHQIPLDFQSTLKPDERFSEAITNTVYRVIQEGLNNILRHARATRVSVVLSHQRSFLSVMLEDDGCGFDPDEIYERRSGRQPIGLIGMKERVELVKGSLEIESMPGKGTTLYIHIPIA